MNSIVIQDAEQHVYNKAHETLDLAAAALLLAGFTSYRNAVDANYSVLSRLLSLSIGAGSITLSGAFRIADYSLTGVHNITKIFFDSNNAQDNDENDASNAASTKNLLKVFGTPSVEAPQNAEAQVNKTTETVTIIHTPLNKNEPTETQTFRFR